MKPSPTARVALVAVPALAVLVFALMAAGPEPAAAIGIPSITSLSILGDAIDSGVDAVGGVMVDGFKEIIDWMFGGLQATITLALIKFLIHIDLPIGGSLYRATGPMVAIGGFFLVVGLVTSIGDGYREIAAGTDTGPRVIGQVIFRSIGLALLLGCWYWVVPMAVDVANGMSGFVLSDDQVRSALRRSFITSGNAQLLPNPLLAIISVLAVIFTVFTLVVLKFIMTIAFACIYVGGPVAIGFAALPRVGTVPLAMVTRGLFVLTIIPLLWSIVFVAWAGVSAGFADVLAGDGAPIGRVGFIGSLMGPCLFLAGLLVILGMTKKAMSMATFGIQPSLPGSGAGRIAMGIGMYQGIRNGLTSLAYARAGVKPQGGPSDPSSNGGGSGGKQPSGNGGGSGGSSNGGSPGRGGGPRERAANAARRLLDSRVADIALGSDAMKRAQSARMQEEGRRDQQRRQEQTRRAEEQDARSRDTLTSLTPMKEDGTPLRRAPHPKDRAAMRKRMNKHPSNGSVSQAQLREVKEDLPPGDRSVIGAISDTAVAQNADNPVQANVAHRKMMTNHYAGVKMTTDQRDAIDTVALGSPNDVREVFGPDYEKFSRKLGPSGGESYDKSLFNDPSAFKKAHEPTGGGGGSSPRTPASAPSAPTASSAPRRDVEPPGPRSESDPFFTSSPTRHETDTRRLD